MKNPAEVLVSMTGLKKVLFTFFSDLACFRREMDAPDMAADSHRGLVRKYNEDSYLYIKGSRKTPSIAIIADGIGGHHNGEIASGLLLRMFLAKWRKYVHPGKTYCCKTLSGFLAEEFSSINDSIARINDRFGSAYPMGSTLSSVAFFRNYLISFHAGDSRLYRIRDGKIAILTRDHSMECSPLLRKKLAEKSRALEIASGKTPSGKAGPRHLITKAVGTRKNCPPECNIFPVQKGDRFIVCSDGLYVHVPPEKMKEIVLNSSGVSKAVSSLINTALHQGGTDNVTVICAFCPEK